MPVQLKDRCKELVEKLGLVSSTAILGVEPLIGGVSSDIAVVETVDRKICIKFALEKLRVAEEWHAPIDRNDAEYAWLEFAGRAVPGSTPLLFGRVAELNGFAMEFIQGDDIYLWKSALLERQPNRREAEKVGLTLGEIHAASTASGFDISQFQNQADFFDLRLDPYLAFTATAHPELAVIFQNLIDTQKSNSLVLIHGDVSPKNILFRGGQAVFLDAECATMGDPSFDVAFCLNHLALKSFYMPDQSDTILNGLCAFWAAYAKHVGWEDPRGLERRVCELIPALMLARIDGKSPVEYLDEEARGRVRAFSTLLVANPPSSLNALARRIKLKCKAKAE